MPTKNPTKISSLRELQALMPHIVPEVNANPQLALAAAANPLLALEYLGYKLTDQAIREIEPYARFGPDGLKRLANLEQQWTAQFGSQPMPLEKETVRKFLMQMSETSPEKKKTAKTASPQAPVSKQVDTAMDIIFSQRRIAAEEEKSIADTLTKLHPALLIVRAYHKILRQRPAFASNEQFQKLLSGKSKSVATSVEFRLKARQE